MAGSLGQECYGAKYGQGIETRSVVICGLLEGVEWDKKIHFWQNEPEKLLKTKDRPFKMGQNEPKNEAEKSFRIASVEKTNRNKPEKETAEVVENKQQPRLRPGEDQL